MSKRNKLKHYRERRDFKRSPEPQGGRRKPSKRSKFVIQKHAARNVHYDFRLEIDGVLVSWAVPKGPSTDPRVRRLAVRTDNHPLEYASFEGVIPEGHYGAGTVMVWDRGTYRNIKKKDGKKVPMKQCLKNGQIEVFLNGKKIKGGYALVRTKRNWLLVKMRDEYADARRKPTNTQNNSVKTAPTMAQIRREQ